MDYQSLKAVGTAVVIGGNRGIGLGFVKEYLTAGYCVYATYREQSNQDELLALKKIYSNNLLLISLDVRDKQAIAYLSEEIKGFIDVLILNAGIIRCPSGSHSLIETEEQLRETMEVNTFAHDNIMRALFSKLLHANSCAVYISSTLSSTADNLKGRFGSYRASKAAGNILMQTWNIELASIWLNEGNPLGNRPCAFPISPGLVQTDMGGGRGELTVKQSVSQMISVIEKVREHKHCSLYLYDGSILQSYPEPLIASEQTA
ncbi:SDR family NAD(P)-dependent oxidoreductase [Legionella hackeliae]|uniref:Putative Acetoacetyl-CoA reductase n=1 Tax=Legionella hackeliae TaxID=449 RepID=A0A0A8ULA0_LEGHA|nr:SDR family NAD(P)-dependent oxidoreductase [Legionella hackeliae]KTD10111.1 C-factor [Legionella hackeliae]CEK09600.1 putative Acetoacetyl-CoA reductase [Legionella hackeliae]STX49511.1 C signal [Legionella hackeliae]